MKRHTALALALCAALPAMAAPPETLVLAIGGEPATGFDPILGWGSYGNPLFQSTLLRRDADLTAQPDLATETSLSGDGTVWTITLRQDVRFSDGTPLTAADVAFTFNTAKTAAGPIDLSVMTHAKPTGVHTLRITLTRPWITFAETFFTLGIVPRANYGPGYGRAPIGSGPYRLLSWAEGEQLLVERNPHYSGPAPTFDRIAFLFTGPETGLAAARTQQAHMVAVPPQMANSDVDGFRPIAVQTVDNRGLSLPFNAADNPITADPAIRRAINLGLDREVLVTVALEGHGTPAFGPADGLPWGGTNQVTFDPAAATALLDASGWAPGPDGIRTKNGLRAAFPINYPASDPTRQALAETTAQLLRPLGIEATANGSSWDAIDRVMHSQPVIFGFGSHSPYQVYSLYAARLGGVEYMNPTHYSNPQVDALFDQAQAAPTLTASYPLWAEAADHYGTAGDNAWAWLVNLDHIYLTDTCLDLGPMQIEPHGHGWPITATLPNWRWTC